MILVTTVRTFRYYSNSVGSCALRNVGNIIYRGFFYAGCVLFEYHRISLLGSVLFYLGEEERIVQVYRVLCLNII